VDPDSLNPDPDTSAVSDLIWIQGIDDEKWKKKKEVQLKNFFRLFDPKLQFTYP
jgi:hypothetical protein